MVDSTTTVGRSNSAAFISILPRRTVQSHPTCRTIPRSLNELTTPVRSIEGSSDRRARRRSFSQARSTACRDCDLAGQ